MTYASLPSQAAAEGLPLVAALPVSLTAVQAFLRCAALPHCLFLDSARRHAELGRYSFVAADPFDWLAVPANGTDGLTLLAERLRPFATRSVAGLPPFQGGAAGMWGYDLNRSLERVPPVAFDEFQAPAMAIGLYDLVLAFDHEQQTAVVISQGFPEIEPAARRRRATQRIEQFLALLEKPPAERPCMTVQAIPAEQLAHQFEVAGAAELTSNFSRSGYLAAVERAIEYIRAGDLFQVNLSQRLLHAAREDSVSLYLRLRERNPAPFAGYFDMGALQIASASPERFMQHLAGAVETRPIKGTRQRTRRPEADLYAADELEQSEKDRAENVMIVDLLRNDLSRVCRSESVYVSQLCRPETYEFVQHLVSAVRGTLRPGVTPVDLLRATFPGGSITGAPKVRAMEIIAELEPTARGPYCGCMGYLGFDGTLDTNILIRTVTAGRGWWQAQVGGGIVAQSHPVREYEETWHKAAGLLRAFA